MAYVTGTDLLVLHTLRCIGFASVGRIADAAGLPPADVTDELIDLGAAGHAELVPGEFGGWHITDAGKASDADRIADELETARTRPVVEDAFERFLVLNPRLLDVCTAWQMRTIGGTATPNDHSDPAYDSRVLDRLLEIHERAHTICRDLSDAMLRFERYGVRLNDALERVESGSVDALADTTDSYHSVWFQLHEDLLLTLGRPRF